ncbi:hypothetical protein ABK040_008086 [Willaertia magna]
MSFFYLVTSQVKIEATGTDSVKSKSKKGNRPTTGNKENSFSIKEEVLLFNMDIDRAIVLLDKIKELCGYQEIEILDLALLKTGECCMLHLHEMENPSKYLKIGEKYIACKVEIKKADETTALPLSPRGNQKKKKEENTTIKTFTSLVQGNAEPIVVYEPGKKPKK